MINEDPNDKQTIININPEVIAINLLQIDLRCQQPRESSGKFDASSMTPFTPKQASREA